ncbi:MAG: flagellar hook-length control protein FliK [Lachnospiraceae bacterium]|nr:flagellar hook-length control protein FliK [Lachnospiraceae bacterium]
MVSAGVMGSNFLPVSQNTETNTVDASESKVDSFKNFMNSAKTDSDSKEVNVGETKGDKAEEIKNLFEKSTVNQGNATDKITEEEIVEATEELVTDLIKNVVEIVSEVMGIDEKEVEEAIKELNLDTEALLSKNGLSELMKQLTGKENVIELLTNSELSDMFKNIVEQVEETVKLFMETNSISKEQLVEMVSEIDLQSVSEEVTEEVVTDNEVKTETAYHLEKESIVTEGNNDAFENVSEFKNDTVQTTEKFNDTSKENGNDMMQNNQSSAFGLAENIANAVEELNIDMDIEPQQLVRQIVDEIRASVNENVSSIEMQLNPESLGKLNIQLVSRNGEVTANIVAQSENVKEVIESQITMLKDTLLEQGIKIEAVEVTVASKGFEENFENQERGNEEHKQKKHISQQELDEINGVQNVSDILEEEMMKQSGNSVSIKA